MISAPVIFSLAYMSDKSCSWFPDLGSDPVEGSVEDSVEDLGEGFSSWESRVIEHGSGVETVVCTGVWTSPDNVEYYFRISDGRRSRFGGVSSIRLIPVEDWDRLGSADSYGNETKTETEVNWNPFLEENFDHYESIRLMIERETGISPETRIYLVNYYKSNKRDFVIRIGDNFADRIACFVCLEAFLRSLGYRIVWIDIPGTDVLSLEAVLNSFGDRYFITVHDIVSCESDEC